MTESRYKIITELLGVIEFIVIADMSNHKYRCIQKNICVKFSLQLTAVNYLQWVLNFIDNQYNVIQTAGRHKILLQILNQYFSHL